MAQQEKIIDKKDSKEYGFHFNRRTDLLQRVLGLLTVSNFETAQLADDIIGELSYKLSGE